MNGECSGLFAAGWQKVMKKGKGFYALKSQIISENSPIIKGTWGHTSEWPLKNVSHQCCAFTVYCSWTVTEGQTFSFIYYPECCPAFLKTVFYIKKMQYTLIYVPCVKHYCRLVFKFQKTSCDESSVCVFVCVCEDACICMKCLAHFDMSLSVPIAKKRSPAALVGRWLVVWEGADTLAYKHRHWHNCECHLAFAGPCGGAGPSERYAKEWVVTGVGEIEGREQRTEEKRKGRVCEIADWSASTCLLLIANWPSGCWDCANTITRCQLTIWLLCFPSLSLSLFTQMHLAVLIYPVTAQSMETMCNLREMWS